MKKLILEKTLEYILSTNEWWDNVKESRKLYVALGSFTLIALLFSDTFFVIFAVLIVAWRKLGGMFGKSE